MDIVLKQDRTFAQNLAGLVIAAMLAMILLLGSGAQPHGSTTMISHSDMAYVQGQGWGRTLLVGGLLIGAVAIALVATGGVIAIAGAFAYTGATMVSVVGAGAGMVATGSFIGTISAGALAVSQWAQ